MDPLWRPLARRPSAVLLAVQLIGVLLYPFLDGPGGRALLSVFGILVLFLAVRTVQATPALTWVAIGLGLPIVLLSAVEVIDPDNARVGLATSILFAAFYGYTSYALIRYMFNDRVVTNDELYATGATFTVVAWGSPTPTWRSPSSSPARSAGRVIRRPRRAGSRCSSCRSRT